MSKQHQIHIAELERHVPCAEHESVYAAARRNGVRIVGACGGRGTCGTCMVQVVEGRAHREGEGAHRKWVRACRVFPRSDLALQVAPRSLAPVVRADVRDGGDNAPLPLLPAVFECEVSIDPASLQDISSDLARVRRALRQQAPQLQPSRVDAAALRLLPQRARDAHGHLALRLRRGSEGITLAGVAEPGRPLLGLAVDLGTTNAAAFMLDLRTGQRLASLGLENPQVAWGADLISRINHAIKDTATAEHLRAAAVQVLNALAHDLALAVGATVDDIVDVAVCGNTAMQHLLLGWPVAQLGRAPFVAASSEAVDLSAASAGLVLAAGAALHVAPAVGGFVGGDHVTALLATEPLWRQPGHTLVMDIGTNTEISLIRHGADGATRIWSASCPSGPALEGGHIGSGMRAAEGAIERVAIVDGALQLGVIGKVPPVGLCGSGVLDALAAFVRAGWIDTRGRIGAVHAQVGSDGARTLVLAAETPDAPAVAFSQNDVRAVQLAKSAIRTGTLLLAAEADIAEAQIDRLVIAGAFGAYIQLESAITIGLLPDLPRGRFSQVGNAAGLGVQQMLASTRRREDAARLATECRYVELSSRSDFQKTFLQHIGFAAVTGTPS